MDKIRVDKGIIPPILLGCFSVVGLCFVLLIARFYNPRAALPVNATETPFRYVYLGTEPAALSLTPEETETPFPLDLETLEASSTPDFIEDTPIILSPRPTNTYSYPVFSTGTPIRTATYAPVYNTLTPTLVYTPTPGATVYDDADFRLSYAGNWIPQTNVSGTYQKTLHISTTVGDTVSFTFIGQQVEVTYQAGPSLGKMTITLDSLALELDQLSGSTSSETWTSGDLLIGTHTVVITHTSGGYVNIDSVTIPVYSTATPTSTP